MALDRSGESLSGMSLAKGCIHFIIIFTVYMVLAYMNTNVFHSFLFFSAINVGFLVAILVLAARAIRSSTYYRIDRSNVRSGKSLRFSFTWIFGLFNCFLAISPFLYFITSYDTGLHLYDYSRGDVLLGISILFLSLFGFLLGMNAFNLRINAEIVEYGLKNDLKLNRSSFLIAGVVLMTNLIVVLHYVLNGLHELFYLFSSIGLIMSSIYMIGLIIITKPGSVKQVYDIPWWREFYDVVEEFNRKYGMNLGCGFAHRITVDKPPQDIFDEVSIGYIKKSHLIIDILSIGSPGGTLIAAKEVCTLWKVDEHSWHMLIFRNDEIATNLSRFIEQKFNVTIEQVQQTSEFIKNRARTSGLCRVITTR